MAGSPLHRLFHFGAVGTLSDAQLLDRFASRRDEAAEAAFEELVIRHGPMMFRVCLGVLHDAHDAEDAFQAVFLVLASRAGTIRRSGSVASWLFGVAQRVASRARRGVARGAGSTSSSPSGPWRAISRRRPISIPPSSTKRSTTCPSGYERRSCSATCKG